MTLFTLSVFVVGVASQAPECFFTALTATTIAPTSPNNYTLDGEPCNVRCSSDSPCSGNNYTAINGASMFLSCSGPGVCTNLVVTVDHRSRADVFCTGDGACMKSTFSNYGVMNTRFLGLNTAYGASIKQLNKTAVSSAWCDSCYGLSIAGDKAGARSEIFCTRADAGNCGFFGVSGNICCRGVGCDYHDNLPALC